MYLHFCTNTISLFRKTHDLLLVITSFMFGFRDLFLRLVLAFFCVNLKVSFFERAGLFLTLHIHYYQNEQRSVCSSSCTYIIIRMCTTGLYTTHLIVMTPISIPFTLYFFILVVHVFRAHVKEKSTFELQPQAMGLRQHV